MQSFNNQTKKISITELVLERYIVNKYITDLDLLNLFNNSSEYGLFAEKNITTKDILLKYVYNNPFVLRKFDFNVGLTKMIEEFIAKRYSMELDELKVIHGIMTREYILSAMEIKNIYYPKTLEQQQNIKIKK